MLLRDAEPILPSYRDAKAHPSIVEEIAAEGRADFYFFAKGILRYPDLNIETHKKMCDFLCMTAWKRKILYIPRIHFKTTVGSISKPLHNLALDSEWSTLWVHENADKAAEEILYPVKQHIRHNQLYRACYPEVCPDDFNSADLRWHTYAADVKRPQGYTGPIAFQVMGIEGTPEGKHRREVIFDDVFARKASQSPAIAQAVFKFFRTASSLLKKPGEDYITLYGTRWHMQDLLDHIIRNVGAVLLDQDGTAVKDITTGPTGKPVYLAWVRSWKNESGEAIFPENFTPDVIEQLRAEHGSFEFAMQYENNPIDPGNTTVNPLNLRYYEHADVGVSLYDPLKNEYGKPITREMVDCIVIMDPAIGSKEHHSSTALLVLWITSDRRIIVREAIARTNWHKTTRAKIYEGDPNVLGWLDQLFAWQKEYQPRTVYFESVAYQKVIGYDIRERNWDEEFPIIVEEVKLGGRAASKDTRIRSVLQPATESHRLYLNKTQQWLIDELIQHPFGPRKDGLDCLAHGIPLLMQPVTNEEATALNDYEEEGWRELGVDTGYGQGY